MAKITLSARIPVRSGQSLDADEEAEIKRRLANTDIANWLKRHNPSKWTHLDSVMDTIVIMYQV